MKKEKKLFQLPSLTTMEGEQLSVNDFTDIESGFRTCDSGCDNGCSTGTGTPLKYTPPSSKCKPCLK